MVQEKNNNKPTVIITRFSAIGDVAMTIPLLYSLAVANLNHNFVFVSQEFLRSMFVNLPDNVEFRGIKLKKNKSRNLMRKVIDSAHNYITLLKLGQKLKKEYNVAAFADLHNETKSHFLSIPFVLSKTKVIRSDSKKAERKALTDSNNHDKVAIENIFDRHKDVYEKLGFRFTPNFISLFGEGKGDISTFSNFMPSKGADKWIGIAPFANHKGKIYPKDKIYRVIELLSQKQGIKIFCFGNGKTEENIINYFCNSFDNVYSLVGKSNFEGELKIMSHLDVMLSMDSANMHLASLVRTPVISIWGATSPLAGFLGWNQNETDCVQLSLKCRPCSIYGNKPCKYGDYRCMEIMPEDIVEKITEYIQ